MIRDQIRYNENLYIIFIKNAYHATFVKGMKDYLNWKRYGLGINMIILGSNQSKTPEIVYGERHENSGLQDHVFIYKSGEHYDAIIPKNPVFVKKKNMDFISSPGGYDGELASLLPIDDNDSDKCKHCLNSKQFLHRYSVDSAPMNSHGRCLLEFCQTSGLFVANGRVGNDRGVGK